MNNYVKMQSPWPRHRTPLTVVCEVVPHNLIQTRTHNEANEITDITETTGPAWITPDYDAQEELAQVESSRRRTSS